MLEVAEYFSDNREKMAAKSKRDIIFAAWSGEELGLLGSKYYVENYPVPMTHGHGGHGHSAHGSHGSSAHSAHAERQRRIHMRRVPMVPPRKIHTEMRLTGIRRRPILTLRRSRIRMLPQSQAHMVLTRTRCQPVAAARKLHRSQRCKCTAVRRHRTSTRTSPRV